MAGDLARSMSLEGREGRSGRPAASGGSSGGAAAAPAVSTGSLPDSLMLCSAECSPVAAAGPDPRHHQHQQAQQQQAQRQQQQQQQPQQQRTPRSESRTPGGMQPAPCTGGGAGSGGLRPRPTPMRLYDALSLHPTSPSDPGLEGQLDLRKVGGKGSKSVGRRRGSRARRLRERCMRVVHPALLLHAGVAIC